MVLMCLGCVFGLAGQVLGVISGSPHDFTGKSWNPGDELCQPCHTPHDADTTALGSPLWNHELTAASFTLYASGTLDATDVGQPDGISKLCLSCHDGTVALDSFGGATGSNFILAPYLVGDGADLTGEHPISFTYNTGLADADGELVYPETAMSGLGGTIQADLLVGDQLGCFSCHDVHDTQAVADGHLLVKDNTGSELCLTCHIK
jgi:predicted CXXCH cytochrome family protein